MKISISELENGDPLMQRCLTEVTIWAGLTV